MAVWERNVWLWNPTNASRRGVLRLFDSINSEKALENTQDIHHTSTEARLEWTSIDADQISQRSGDQRFTVPLARLHSLRRVFPALGVPQVTIVTKSALSTGDDNNSSSGSSVMALPTLLFFEGGVLEFFDVLEQYAHLVQARADANTFFVTEPVVSRPQQQQLQELQTSVQSEQSTRTAAPSLSSQSSRPHSEVLEDVMRDLRISMEVLPVQLAHPVPQTMSRDANTPPADSNLSQGSPPQRRTAGAGFDPAVSLLSGFARFGAMAQSFIDDVAHPRPVARYSSSNAQAFSAAGENANAKPAQPASESSPVPFRLAHSTALGVFDVLDDDSDTKRRLAATPEYGHDPEVSVEEWVEYFSAEGRLTDSRGLIKRIYHGGCAPEVRPQAWKFLLGVYDWNSTLAEREKLDTENARRYKTWSELWTFMLRESSIEVMEGGRAGAVLTQRRLDASNALSAHQMRLFKSVQIIEKDVARTDRTLDFYRQTYSSVQQSGAPQAESIPGLGDGGHCDFATNLNLVAMRNVLATYGLYNSDLGYAQGMNELLSPILYVMNGAENDSFWSFVGLMQNENGPHLQGHFHKDQLGMQHELSTLARLVRILDPGLYDYLESIEGLNCFFAFRWLLIIWKREFSFLSVQRLWDVCWAHRWLKPWLPAFSIFLALAVLLQHRERLVTFGFDEMLQFCQGLSETMSLEPLLTSADRYVRLYESIVGTQEHQTADSESNASSHVD